MPTLEDVRRLVAELPETEEKPSYGTPGFRVRKKLIARARDDGATLVMRIDYGEREALMAMEPDTFFITPHYREYPFVLIRLATVDPEELRALIVDAWRTLAPKRVVAAYDAAS